MKLEFDIGEMSDFNEQIKKYYIFSIKQKMYKQTDKYIEELNDEVKTEIKNLKEKKIDDLNKEWKVVEDNCGLFIKEEIKKIITDEVKNYLFQKETISDLIENSIKYEKKIKKENKLLRTKQRHN